MTDTKQSQAALLLCAMMVFAPALGYPTDELLQDTFKSILVSFFTLTAAFIFFWRLRKQVQTIHAHVLLVLPVLLSLYAMGSMVWSHTYLGGVEAIRWFLFSLILFLGMNTLTPARVTQLAWGIHLGAVIASIWTALQFWANFDLFPQGPNPASTFVNRNFFGEFIVCTFPFSVLLLTRIKDKTSVFLLTFSLGFNIVALMMTGTRSALTGLLLLTALIPFIVFVYRKQIQSKNWRVGHWLGVIGILAGTIGVLGSIENNNPQIAPWSEHVNALDRALARTLSITKPSEYSVGSFSIRAVMWRATGRMIKENPLLGVGAGAWEVHAPIYQDTRNSLETDYYAHNEIWQVLAEYGVVGWTFLLCLASYLFWAAYRTWTNKSEQGQSEAPLRALTLSSLLMLFLVSNAGFPWRMATTGALFALSLSILAASDIRLSTSRSCLVQTARWKPKFSNWALLPIGLCSVLAIYIAHQAIECERKIVRAVKLAMVITQSGRSNDPGLNSKKAEMLALLKDGIVINPHYRKLTPIVADSLAGWGDWNNAVWVWESVLESRPYVFPLLANITRGQMQIGNLAQASKFLERAKAMQPDSPTIGTLDVMLMSRIGKVPAAVLRAKELLRNNVTDPDLLRTAYYLGMRNNDPALAIQALELRIRTTPQQAIDGWLKLGQIYDTSEAKNQTKAIQSYQAAYAAAESNDKDAVLAMIPLIYHSKIK
jgi:O-antigen ligase